MEQLYQIYEDRLARTDTSFLRYLHNEIDWKSRLIVIVGARGVGKTTMVLQHIILSGAESSSLYVSADSIYFGGHTLYEVADTFCKQNGKFLYIDEAHKYKGWSSEVKMMYDNLPDLNIVVTGSSILDIKKGTEADLSRRAISYEMEGMSFREYLNFSLGENIEPYSLEDIISRKVELPASIPHPLPLWQSFLKKGCFPFFNVDNYYSRLDSIVNQTLEIDIPSFVGMSASSAAKLKRLLFIISRSVPFKPNFTQIGSAIGADRGKVADYFVYMEKAGLIRQLRVADESMKLIEKVDKVYLSNPTLVYAESEGTPEIGNVRETAFLYLTSVRNKVTSSPVSDFQIEGYTFEPGGKGKKQKQIKDVENGFVVKDDIERGYLNVVPLWQFGLNY